MYCQAFGFERRFLWQVQNILYPGPDGWDVFLVTDTEECEAAGFIFVWDSLKMYSSTQHRTLSSVLW